MTSDHVPVELRRNAFGFFFLINHVIENPDTSQILEIMAKKDIDEKSCVNRLKTNIQVSLAICGVTFLINLKPRIPSPVF